MKIALGQPGMGGPEDDYTGTEDMVTLPDNVYADYKASLPTPDTSILGVLGQTGSNLLETITQGDVVKATLNKYVFGNTTPIPTSGTVQRVGAPATGQIVAGIPNLYLALGAAALFFVLLKLMRGR